MFFSKNPLQKAKAKFYALKNEQYKDISKKINEATLMFYELTNNQPLTDTIDFEKMFQNLGNKVTEGDAPDYDYSDEYIEWNKKIYLRNNTTETYKFISEYIELGGELTEDFIKLLHIKLLAGFDPNSKYIPSNSRNITPIPGQYRKNQGAFGTLEYTIFYGTDFASKYGEQTVLFSPSENIPSDMKKFIAKYAPVITSASEPLKDIAAMYGDFIKIHPFGDANGRVGRALVNFALMKNGLLPVDIKNASLDGITMAACSVDYHESRNPIAMAAILGSAELVAIEEAIKKKHQENFAQSQTEGHLF